MSLEKKQHESLRWLSQGQADLRAADASLAAGSYEWACFQSQQAAEKALKSFWLYRGLDPWGHSLVKLMQDFPDAGMRSKLEQFLDHAKRLDKLYIPTRYPNGLPDSTPAEVYTREEAEDAMRIARELITGVTALMA